MDGPFYVRDAGVVVLDDAYETSPYGTLPAANALDSLKPRRSTSFTSVGYGLQKSFPDAAAWKNVADKTRMVAYPQLLQINTGFTGPQSLLLSNNTNTGGTCFGDSGGPNFLGDSNVVAGITSFGLNSTCAGTGGVFRTDRPDVRNWILSFLD
ncbi:MAG: trypsin-like serine protease [Gaiella sp.]|nr:trypsin-like serine protease [Gaiella sp.]